MAGAGVVGSEWVGDAEADDLGRDDRGHDGLERGGLERDGLERDAEEDDVAVRGAPSDAVGMDDGLGALLCSCQPYPILPISMLVRG